MRALAAALGGEGGGCVAVLEPALDVGTLHRFLLKHRAPGVRRVGAGLGCWVLALGAECVERACSCRGRKGNGEREAQGEDGRRLGVLG